jgi:Tfp pilus assembly protein PilO
MGPGINLIGGVDLSKVKLKSTVAGHSAASLLLNATAGQATSQPHLNDTANEDETEYAARLIKRKSIPASAFEAATQEKAEMEEVKDFLQQLLPQQAELQGDKVNMKDALKSGVILCK